VTERLQKILARAGFGSRRAVESLISAGRVRVNGETASLGARADADTDVVEVDGERVSTAAPSVYLAMNKPAGYVTTSSDPQRRRTVMQLLPDALPPHVVPVGRLDMDTEGLLIFTDDGEFAHRLAHPRFAVEKEYHGLVEGAPSQRAIHSLEQGVMIDDARTAPADVARAQPPYGFAERDGHTWLRLVLHEGRKRQVRRMCAAVGHPVRSLVRTRVDGVLLGRLASGTTRALSERELRELRRIVGLA
jgi:pseudouridine synthase